MAGVPVKYGNCVPIRYSVPSTPSTVTLHNRFQCLQDLCASTDDLVHNDIHTIKSVEKHRDNSVRLSPVGNKIDHVKQHLEECKLPQSCSNDMLQPTLAYQENNTFQGNKNKTGLFDVVSHSMEDQEYVATLTKKQKVGDCLAGHTRVCCERQQGNTQVTSDTQFGPQLASTQNYFLEGNKNKIGSLDGNNWDVRNQNKLDNC